MASYSAKVRKDIVRWRDSGLIDASTADALSADVEANDRRSLSFGTVLATLAALLLGAAIMIFIAANWDGIPRVARVVALLAVIIAAYVGGAVLKRFDHAALGEAAWLIGAAAFGASIGLVGQMYHMGGEETDAILTWCAGTTLAAAMLRSGPLTIAAVVMAWAWMFLLGFEIWGASRLPYTYPLVALVLWLVSYWTASVAARHLILLSLIGFAVLLTWNVNTELVGWSLAAISAAIFAAAVFAPGPAERVARLDGRLAVQGLIGFLAGVMLVQIGVLDGGGQILLAFIAAIAGIVAALLLGGRLSRGLRWIAYVGFAFQLCFIYTVMLGTMLGTAGFLLAAALILGGIALFITRMERRMKAAPAEAAS